MTDTQPLVCICGKHPVVEYHEHDEFWYVSCSDPAHSDYTAWSSGKELAIKHWNAGILQTMQSSEAGCLELIALETMDHAALVQVVHQLRKSVYDLIQRVEQLEDA